MLSRRELQRRAGPPRDHSDEQFGELCEQFRVIAEVIVDLYGDFKGVRAGGRPSGAPFLRLVPAGRIEEAEERAAIREFDGGASRGQAEHGALKDLEILGVR
jgi:hypothetical protein